MYDYYIHRAVHKETVSLNKNQCDFLNYQIGITILHFQKNVSPAALITTFLQNTCPPNLAYVLFIKHS